VVNLELTLNIHAEKESYLLTFDKTIG